jgi:hypothetical protein
VLAWQSSFLGRGLGNSEFFRFIEMGRKGLWYLFVWYGSSVYSYTGTWLSWIICFLGIKAHLESSGVSAGNGLDVWDDFHMLDFLDLVHGHGFVLSIIYNRVLQGPQSNPTYSFFFLTCRVVGFSFYNARIGSHSMPRLGVEQGQGNRM